MNRTDKFIDSFREAWSMVIDVPHGENDNRAAVPFLTAAFIPLAGVVVGVLLTAAGFVLAWKAGAVLWAFAALLVTELVDSGRGSRAFSEYVCKKLLNMSDGYFMQAAGTLLLIFKLAALYVISRSGNCGFMIVFFVVVFSVEMYLAAMPERGAILEVDEDEKRFLWVIPGVVVFLTFWIYPFAVLFSVLAAWGTIVLCRKKIWAKDRVLTGDDITFASGVCEAVLFAVAIITLGV